MPTAPGHIQNPARILRFFSVSALFDVKKVEPARGSIILQDNLGRHAGYVVGTPSAEAMESLKKNSGGKR
jgi:hypothetical protein